VSGLLIPIAIGVAVALTLDALVILIVRRLWP